MAQNPSRPRQARPSLPSPIRAVLGVIATVVDDRQSLPDRALELPVLVVSTALQMSLRAQQRYAALTTKGDEFLSQIRGAPEEPPEWARFDDDEPADFGAQGEFDGDEVAARRDESRAQAEEQAAANAANELTAIHAFDPPELPAKKAAPKSAAPKKTTVKSAAAKSAAPQSSVPQSSVPKSSVNSVKAPRKRKPSAFDQVPDEPVGPLAGLADLEGFSIPHPLTED